MPTRVMPHLGRLVTATLAVATFAAPASAAAPTDDPSYLTLALRESHSGQTRTVTLTCNPPGGSHPRPAAACSELTAAKGDFGGVQTHSGQCPLIYKPVSATAHGQWQHEPIVFSKQFPNACVAATETAGIFAF